MNTNKSEDSRWYNNEVDDNATWNKIIFLLLSFSTVNTCSAFLLLKNKLRFCTGAS